MKNIRLCIFDLDGTLADTLRSIAFFANEALLLCGHRGIPLQSYRYLAGNGADALMRGMLKTTAGDYTEEDVLQLRAVYDRLYESDPLRETTAFPGMTETLEALRAKGIFLAMLSNKPHKVAQAVMEKLYPQGLFARCYGQREGLARKPAPDGALLIARELGVLPEECLYIGDTDVDMKTGRAAGMRTVGVLWGFRDRQELEENHADFIIAHPEDLLGLVEEQTK